MRDIAVLILVMIGLGFASRSPHYGVLLWSWLGYMNPHRLGWGFAYNFPFAQITAVFVFLALLFSKDDKRFPLTPTTVIWILFLLWTCLTTLFAWHQDAATEQLTKVMKIQSLIFVTMMVFKTRERIDQLIWVIVISIGFFGVKGGLFTIRTAGNFHVWGPPGSFIEDNNELAVALVMILPLMFYLRRYAKQQWLKLALAGSILLTMVSIAGSQSRGALIAVIALSVYFWFKSRHKIRIGAGIFIVAISVFSFMPQSWHERMESIGNYEEDASAMGRINAWTFAYRVANDNISGGGFNIWTQSAFEWYVPGVKAFAAHSVYFSILGEHGWIGLFLFLLILLLSWQTAKRLVKHHRKRQDSQWIADLASMIQVSLVAYMSGGAFLSLSYFDLPWHMFAILIILRKFFHEPILLREHNEQAALSKVNGVMAR